MTKLLLFFTGILTISTASSTIISQEVISKESKETLLLPHDWNLKPTSIEKETSANEWLYFAVNNINLTSFGVRDILDLHYWYKTIELPEFIVKFDNQIALNGDKWNARELGIGSEDWHRQFTKIEEQTTMILERACTLWYSVVDRSLMLRLAYHASIVTSASSGGTIMFESGSVVKFY